MDKDNRDFAVSVLCLSFAIIFALGMGWVFSDVPYNSTKGALTVVLAGSAAIGAALFAFRPDLATRATGLLVEQYSRWAGGQAYGQLMLQTILCLVLGLTVITTLQLAFALVADGSLP